MMETALWSGTIKNKQASYVSWALAQQKDNSVDRKGWLVIENAVSCVAAACLLHRINQRAGGNLRVLY